MNKQPKVSIVTICFNSAGTIAETLVSVSSQTYPNIEHVIVDGLSSDDTLEVIHQHMHPGIHLLSEKDHGLYDALNKGLKLCTGDIIGVLHSDDHLAHTKVIEQIVAEFVNDHHLDALSASVEIFKPTRRDKPFRVYNATKFKPWQFRLGMQPPHPGFYISRAGLDRVGFFNSSYKISGDFDWLLRAILEERLNVKYTEFIAVNMLDGGVSSSGLNSKKVMNKENLRILKAHGIYSNKVLIYLKYFWKIFQFRF